jgi:hypothetical protein
MAARVDPGRGRARPRPSAKASLPPRHRRECRDPMVSQMEDFTSSRAFRVAGPNAFCRGRHHPQRCRPPDDLRAFAHLPIYGLEASEGTLQAKSLMRVRCQSARTLSIFTRAAEILGCAIVAAGFELPVAASSVKSPSAPPRTVGANRRSGIGAIGRARLPAARFIPRMRIAWHLDAQTVNGRMGAAQQCA